MIPYADGSDSSFEFTPTDDGDYAVTSSSPTTNGISVRSRPHDSRRECRAGRRSVRSRHGLRAGESLVAGQVLHLGTPSPIRERRTHRLTKDRERRGGDRCDQPAVRLHGGDGGAGCHSGARTTIWERASGGGSGSRRAAARGGVRPQSGTWKATRSSGRRTAGRLLGRAAQYSWIVTKNGVPYSRSAGRRRPRRYRTPSRPTTAALPRHVDGARSATGALSSAPTIRCVDSVAPWDVRSTRTFRPPARVADSQCCIRRSRLPSGSGRAARLPVASADGQAIPGGRRPILPPTVGEHTSFRSPSATGLTTRSRSRSCSKSSGPAERWNLRPAGTQFEGGTIANRRGGDGPRRELTYVWKVLKNGTTTRPASASRSVSSMTTRGTTCRRRRPGPTARPRRRRFVHGGEPGPRSAISGFGR